MRQKKKTANRKPIRGRSIIPEIVESDLPEAIDITPDPEEESLERMVAQFGTGLVVKVYKIEQGQRGYCCNLDSPQGMTEDTIRELGFGPGRYLLHFYKDGELRDARDIILLEKPGISTAIVRAQPQEATESPMMRLLMQQMGEMQKLILAMIQGGTQREREPISELAAALKSMHEMSATQKELPSEMLLKVLEMGVSIASAKGGDDSLMGTIREIAKDFAPHLVPALLGARQAPAQPAHQLAQPQQTLPSQSPMDPDTIKLKQGLNYLKGQCMKQLDPLLFVDLIGANADSEPYASLIRRILTSEFSAFETIDPDLRAEPYHAFFLAIFNGLRSAFAREDTVEGDPGGEGGNDGDIARDAKASQ